MSLQPRILKPARASWQKLGDSPVDDFLRRVHLFARLVRGGELAGWSLAVGIAAVLAVILSDAFFAWPAAVRIGLNGLAILGLIAFATMLLWRLFGGRYRAAVMARLAEEQLQRRDSLLINAVEFRSGEESGSEALRESVVRSADAVVTQLPASVVTPASPALRATLFGLAAAATFGVAFLAVPRLFAAVIPRFLDPHGDHPPFTLLRFSPTVKPLPLHRGRPAMVSVEITGPERVEEATLVIRPAGTVADDAIRLPMFRQTETTFTAEVANVNVDSEFHISTPRGRSGWFDLKVSGTPLIGEARVTLNFPAYTGWKPREQGLNERGVRGLRGTTCRLAIRSNLVLASGEVRLFTADATAPSATIPLKPRADDGHIATGEFGIGHNGRFEIVVRSETGQDSETLSGPIVALADRPPRVAITSPAETLIAVEGWKVPIEIQASDDVGIQRIRLFRGVNGWSASALTLPHTSDEAGVARSAASFDLGTLGAKAGDVIHYYASVDEDASDRPQSTDTAVHTIQVISEEEYRDFARQQYQLDELSEEFESFRRELERLSDMQSKAAGELEQLLKKQDAGEPLTDADRERIAILQKQMSDFARETAELSRTLAERAGEMQLYDLEQRYAEELQKLAKDLAQQADGAEHLAKLLEQQRESSSPKLADELKDTAGRFVNEPGPLNEATREQLDGLAEDLETIQKADALNEQVNRLQAVTAQQRDLVNRMAELAGKTSLTPDEEARSDRFAREQELLAQELESIQDELREAATEAAEKLPQMSGSARSLAETLDQLAIPQEQLAAARQARGQQGDAAHRHAEAAARKLESLMKTAGEIESAPGLSEGLDGPLQLSQQQLRNTLQQLRRGRRPPGLGQRGRGPGSGSEEGGGPGPSGRGQATGGNQGRLRPGQSGRSGDSDAQVMGPRTREPAEPSGRSSMRQADGQGRFVLPGASGDAASAETLSPASRRSEGLSGPNLRGVPVGYRDAAEAYFRRLSEEKNSK